MKKYRPPKIGTVCICEFCKKEFKYATARFCSLVCRRNAKKEKHEKVPDSHYTVSGRVVLPRPKSES